MVSVTDHPETQYSTNLAHQFLVAMPGMVSGVLANTLIYVCEHTEDGALGLVVNRPTDITVGDLLQRIDLDLSLEIGPVQLGGIALTTSRDVLQDVSNGTGPGQLLITLGYAGWGAGQLENEMAQNAWLNVAATNDILFDTPTEQRYGAALAQLGIDPIMLTGDAGHA